MCLLYKLLQEKNYGSHVASNKRTKCKQHTTKAVIIIPFEHIVSINLLYVQ